MKNLGYLTDCIFLRQSGEVYWNDRFWVIRNQHNPTFWWGNFLLYPKAPSEADVKRWLLDFKEVFGSEKGHVAFGWDSESIGATEAFKELGFEYEPMSVLARNDCPPCSDEIGIETDEINFREISSDSDWNAVTALQYEVGIESGHDPASYCEYNDRKFEQYRELSGRGVGSWFGAFDGEKLVADMGLYWDMDAQIARFQSVETAVQYRRRGFCSQLIRFVMNESQRQVELKTWVIVASKGSIAESLYQKQGFSLKTLQLGVCFPRKFDFEPISETF